MKTLTHPLGLNPNMSVTELGSGLGGMSRMLARDGLWVDAYEPDADLVMSATEIARSQGLRQRTHSKNLALDDISLKRKRSARQTSELQTLMRISYHVFR